jgi:hypothetical protein
MHMHAQPEQRPPIAIRLSAHLVRPVPTTAATATCAARRSYPLARGFVKMKKTFTSSSRASACSSMHALLFTAMPSTRAAIVSSARVPPLPPPATLLPHGARQPHCRPPQGIAEAIELPPLPYGAPHHCRLPPTILWPHHRLDKNRTSSPVLSEPQATIIGFPLPLDPAAVNHCAR